MLRKLAIRLVTGVARRVLGFFLVGRNLWLTHPEPPFTILWTGKISMVAIRYPISPERPVLTLVCVGNGGSGLFHLDRREIALKPLTRVNKTTWSMSE